MPFNPNIPQNGDTADADVVRAQFNALKSLIDDQAAAIAALTARVAALEPPPVYTATGFGIDRFNGTLISVGMHNGQHVFTANVNDTTVIYYEQNRWVAAYVSAPGAMDMPDPHPFPMYYIAGTSPVGQWILGNGDAPAGSVS
jgi:hypothetical protein